MESKAPDTLEKIQQTALDEFLEKGFLGASLRQIVKHAGVTTGAFYGYFSRVCHFLKHIETKISLFCKVFLAFFMLLLYNIFVGTTVFSRRVSCLLKPFRIMGKNI